MDRKRGRAVLCMDGVYRVRVRVAYRMGLEELAQLLVKDTAPYTSEEEAPDMSAVLADQAIREALRDWGESVEGWSDRMGEAEAERWMEWAERHVLKAQPDLSPGFERGRARRCADGVYRVDLMPQADLSLMEMAQLLAKGNKHADTLEECTRRADARALLEDAMRSWGEKFEGWSDRLDDEDAEGLLEWARRQVLVMYPELKDESA